MKSHRSWGCLVASVRHIVETWALNTLVRLHVQSRCIWISHAKCTITYLLNQCTLTSSLCAVKNTFQSPCVIYWIQHSPRLEQRSRGVLVRPLQWSVVEYSVFSISVLSWGVSEWCPHWAPSSGSLASLCSMVANPPLVHCAVWWLILLWFTVQYGG